MSGLIDGKRLGLSALLLVAALGTGGCVEAVSRRVGFSQPVHTGDRQPYEFDLDLSQMPADSYTVERVAEGYHHVNWVRISPGTAVKIIVVPASQPTAPP